LIIDEKMGFRDSTLYEQMRNDLRLKLLNFFQKFYHFISQHYDKNQYEWLGLRNVKELYKEVFGIEMGSISYIE
jgi:hypothetical protein